MRNEKELLLKFSFAHFSTEDIDTLHFKKIPKKTAQLQIACETGLLFPYKKSAEFKWSALTTQSLSSLFTPVVLPHVSCVCTCTIQGQPLPWLAAAFMEQRFNERKDCTCYIAANWQGLRSWNSCEGNRLLPALPIDFSVSQDHPFSFSFTIPLSCLSQ